MVPSWTTGPGLPLVTPCPSRDVRRDCLWNLFSHLEAL